MQDKYSCLAKELGITLSDVMKIVELLQYNYTVPYIAKYCKFQIGAASLKNIHHIARIVRDANSLEERRKFILQAIESLHKLSAELKSRITKACNLHTLEDIYLSFLPKRQSKALQAYARDLGQLATKLLTLFANNKHLSNLAAESEAQEDFERRTAVSTLEKIAEEFVNLEKGVVNNKMALDGAKQILIEKFSEDVTFLEDVRHDFSENAILCVELSKARNDKNAHKYQEFANYSKKITQISSPKLVDIFTGRAQSYLKISINLPNGFEYALTKICSFFDLNTFKVAQSNWLLKVIEDTWLQKLLPKFETEILHKLRDIAASFVGKELSFYLRNLFYLPPAGNIVTMGLIPNAKNMVELAIVDEFGNYLANSVILPLGFNGDWYQSLANLAKFAIKFQVSLISVATLPGYRDVERLCRQLIKMYPDLNLSLTLVDAYGLTESAQFSAYQKESEINNLGWSQSTCAAISLARRSQDALAEFSKIDSNDFSLLQPEFGRAKYQEIFDATLEDCICDVGLNLNKANYYVLSKLPGLNKQIAAQILTYREKNGKFATRAELKNISGINDFIYQQVAGFVYIFDGDNVLDSLHIHPDSYYIVDKIAKDLQVAVSDLIANNDLLAKVVPEQYLDAKHSSDNIKLILNWLKYKVNDPRGIFITPKFIHNYEHIYALEKGTELEGIISKITSFGAFVDVGVYQDGLIPLPLIKQITGTRLRVGKVIKVRVIEIDKLKKRFSLEPINIQQRSQLNEYSRTASSQQTASAIGFRKRAIDKPSKINQRKEVKQPKHLQTNKVFNTAMADALAKLKKGEVT